MKKTVFDASSHLGQFCLSSEPIRIGCKNMQASIAQKMHKGIWNDLENGRTDRTIWNLREEVQNAYYPLMDRFFSITSIQQNPMTDEEEEMSLQLKQSLPQLSMYSRYTCARAIAERASGIYTLVEELLSDPTKEYMKTTHGIWVVQPAAVEEQTYVDPELERRYQVCLKTFQQHGLNVVSAIDDSRTIKTV